MNVQEMMDRLGYRTKQQLADKLDVSQGLVSQWASEKAYPSYHVIRKLIELGATVEEIFGVPCPCKKPSEQLLNSDLQRMIESEVQRAVKQALEQLQRKVG